MTIVTKNHSSFPSFSNLFDDFFNTEIGDWKRKNFSATNTTLPKVNISESDEAYTVEVAVPGMNKEDFNVSLDQNILTISSEKETSSTSEDQKFTRREFVYNSFQRSFTLPDTADDDNIHASYQDGILKIAIAKKEEAKPKPLKTIAIA